MAKIDFRNFSAPNVKVSDVLGPAKQTDIEPILPEPTAVAPVSTYAPTAQVPAPEEDDIAETGLQKIVTALGSPAVQKTFSTLGYPARTLMTPVAKFWQQMGLIDPRDLPNTEWPGFDPTAGKGVYLSDIINTYNRRMQRVTGEKPPLGQRIVLGGLGLAGDVLTDPLSYVSIGAKAPQALSKVAKASAPTKGMSAIEQLGKPTIRGQLDNGLVIPIAFQNPLTGTTTAFGTEKAQQRLASRVLDTANKEYRKIKTTTAGKILEKAEMQKGLVWDRIFTPYSRASANKRVVGERDGVKVTLGDIERRQVDSITALSDAKLGLINDISTSIKKDVGKNKDAQSNLLASVYFYFLDPLSQSSGDFAAAMADPKSPMYAPRTAEALQVWRNKVNTLSAEGFHNLDPHNSAIDFDVVIPKEVNFESLENLIEKVSQFQVNNVRSREDLASKVIQVSRESQGKPKGRKNIQPLFIKSPDDLQYLPLNQSQMVGYNNMYEDTGQLWIFNPQTNSVVGHAPMTSRELLPEDQLADMMLGVEEALKNGMEPVWIPAKDVHRLFHGSSGGTKVEGVMGRLKGHGQLSAGEQVIQNLTGAWKGLVMSWPGPQIRNFVGNLTMLENVGVPTVSKKFTDSMTAARDLLQWKPTSALDNLSPDELMYYEAYANGVLGRGYKGRAELGMYDVTDMRGRAAQASKQVIEEGFQKGLSGVSKVTSEIPINLALRTGEAIRRGKPGERTARSVTRTVPEPDEITRLAAYIYKRRQGYGSKEASDFVRKHLIDYQELTPTQRKMKLLFPFGVWTMKGIPETIRGAMRKPGYATIPIKVANASEIAAPSDIDRDKLPPYLQKTIPVRLPWDKGDDPDYPRYIGTANWSAPGQVWEIINSLAGRRQITDPVTEGDITGAFTREGTSMLTPVIKTLIEKGTNRQLDMGQREIKRYPGQTEPILPYWSEEGEFSSLGDIDPWVNEWLRQVPPYQRLESTVKKLSSRPTRTGEMAPEGAIPEALSTFFGQSIYSPNMNPLTGQNLYNLKAVRTLLNDIGYDILRAQQRGDEGEVARLMNLQLRVVQEMQEVGPLNMEDFDPSILD